MSKIFLPIILIFKLIYKIIDFMIVTPVSRIIYKINEVFRDNSGRIEKILNRPNVLIYISLLFAVALFLLVDSQVINLTDREAEVISGQTVNVTYNKEAYVVEGIPEEVEIILMGNKSNIYLATQLGEHDVVLDLSKYGVGTYKVPLKYKNSGRSVDYRLIPETATVKISEKVSDTRSLEYDLMNENKLDHKLSISNVELSSNEVIIKSSQEILDKVSVVKALIDATQVDVKESGTFTIENVTLVAYDSLGNKLDNIETVPSKISAKLTIDSYHSTVPVKVVTTGEMKNGKAISSIKSSVTEVTIYGDKSVIDGINEIEAEVDVSKINADYQTTVNLKKRSGVRFMSQTKTNVTISVDNASQKTISKLSISSLNLASGFTASAASMEDRTVDVIVKGVDSVINSEISNSDVSVWVDLTGLKAGVHTVPIKVTVNDPRITAQATKTEINVKIVQSSSN